MNPATKLALGMLGTAVVGFGLLIYGLWPNYKLGAFIVGGAMVAASVVMFAVIWRSR